jgi:hypothetical protein
MWARPSRHPWRRLSAWAHVYEPRDVGADTLHQVVRDSLATFIAAIEAGFVGGALPKFVRAELEGHLNCSVLSRGFAHLVCEGCGQTRLVAFTCAGRGFAPPAPAAG